MGKVNIYYLIRLFMLKEEEDNPDTQRTYKKYLDKMIDATLVLGYQKVKRGYEFYTIDQLDEYIRYHFGKTSIEELAQKISDYTHKKDKVSYYNEMLGRVYSCYQQGNLTREVTTEFYNEILNNQQDFYFSNEKRKIIRQLTKKLNLTDQKRKNLENGIRLSQALKLLGEKDYNSLNVKEEDILSDLDKLHTRLSYVRELKKTYSLTQQDYEYLDGLFLNNKLCNETLKEKYPFFSKRQLNKIRNKYNQVLLPYLENVDITDERIVRMNVGYHDHHLKFYDVSIHYGNVLAFISSLKYSEIDTILNQYEEVKILFKLLPFVDLLPNFKMETFKNIVLYYPKIEENLISRGELFRAPSIDVILNKLSLIIGLSNVYPRAGCYKYSILGEENIKRILESDNQVCDLVPYILAYTNMLKKNKNTIPPLYGEFGGSTYESGTANRERLLIGAYCYRSCIAPNMAGEEAYYQVLTKENADVLIIKNKKTKCFEARSLLFRKDNFIIMAPIMGERGKKFYNKKFLSQISNELLSAAKEKGDRLDYVFLTRDWDEIIEGLPIITSDSFVRGFPHSDLEDKAYLLGCSEEVSSQANGKIGFTLRKVRGSHRIFYDSSRCKVQVKKDRYQDDIKRIKALEIISEKNKSQQDTLKREFNFLSSATFDEVYVGQDWYIAVKKNKVLSKGIFQISDVRQQEEIRAVEGYLSEFDNDNDFINSRKKGKTLNKRKR